MTTKFNFLKDHACSQKSLTKKCIYFLMLSIFFLCPSQSSSANLKFSANFESDNFISTWHGVGQNAYKTISAFEKLPGSGSPGNFLTVCDRPDIQNYHQANIESVIREGKSSKTLFLSTTKFDYPNRSSGNIQGGSDFYWNEYFQEWKVKYSNTFISKHGSGSYWNSQHTIFHNGLQTIVLQLIGNGGGVYTQFQLYDESYACSVSNKSSGCGFGINKNNVHVNAGELEGSGKFFYLSNKSKKIYGEKWYKFGIYYRGGVGSNGEVIFYIDETPILHFIGDTAGDSSRPSDINYIKLYGSSGSIPHEMWIDDFKIYDGIPYKTSSSVNNIDSPPDLRITR